MVTRWGAHVKESVGREIQALQCKSQQDHRLECDD